MKEKPGVKKNQGQCLHEPSVVPLSLENWLQIIVYLWKQLRHWENTMSLEQWRMNTLFCWCVVPEIKISIPLHGRLFDLHPPPPHRIFCSRGFLMVSLPPEISRILKRGLRLPTLGTRGFSRVRRKFSVSAKGQHIFCQGIAYIGNSKSFWYLKTKKVNTNSVTKVQ